MIGDPPDLGIIATAIRDESWLDMRVCDMGRLDRVRIEQLRVHRERDELVVSQKWLEDGEDLRNDEYLLDMEDVIWLRDTRVALENVKPFTRPTAMHVAPADVNAKKIIDEIVRSQVHLTAGLTEAQLRGGSKQTAPTVIWPRQEALFMAYEMTDESPVDICEKHFGYASQQPLLTVWQKLAYATSASCGVHYREPKGAWLKRVKATVKMIDAHYGLRYRRQTNSPGWTSYL